jgi:hypothetical protein
MIVRPDGKTKEFSDFLRCVNARLRRGRCRFLCEPQKDHKENVSSEIDLQPLRVGDLMLAHTSVGAQGEEGREHRRATGLPGDEQQLQSMVIFSTA